MGFSPIINPMRLKVLDTSETAHMGGYTLAKNGELQWVRLQIYKQGTAGGTEQLRIGVYSRRDLAAKLFHSDWMEVSDWTTAIGAGSNHLGTMRFDFNREQLDKDIEYHFALETNNYTRNGDTFYIAFAMDWPVPIYASTEAQYSAASASIFCYFEKEKPD